jgi:hypothetical protein
MAVIANAGNPTLLDLAKVMDPSGRVGAVIEVMNETNEILPDMTWTEGNLTTGHRTQVRTGIPQPTWRKIGGGVVPNKSTTAQITFNTGMLEEYAEIDKALADLNGNSAAYRLQAERPAIEGMSQEIANTTFYGNEGTQPEAFTGLSSYYNLTTAASGQNIVLGGGAGSDNASIWLVVWGPETIHGIIPKGSKAGIQVEDLGRVTLEDASNGSNTGRMEAYRTHYRWDAGLAVEDWRYAVRIPNIDKSALLPTAASGANLPDLMFQAIELVPNINAGRAVFYMSRTVRTFWRRQTAFLTAGSTLEAKNVGGQIVMDFHGIPVRRCDALAADETLVA